MLSFPSQGDDGRDGVGSEGRRGKKVRVCGGFLNLRRVVFLKNGLSKFNCNRADFFFPVGDTTGIFFSS